jgi:hypothetical protein
MMSDPIAQAAEALSAAPSSTEPLQVAPEVAPVGERSSLPSSGEAGSGDAGNADAPTSPAGAATPAITGNVLLNATPVVDAPVLSDAAIEQPEPEAEPIPRESHLMMLEAKIAGFRAKLANAERVALDEFEAIIAHVKAVL